MGDTGDGGGLFNPQRMINSMLVETDFHSMTHQQMRSMIENAQPAKTSDLGKKLVEAAVAIDRIGTELKTHIGTVAWEGEGGDAFRDWGDRVAKATIRLGEFSAAAGVWMNRAAETLADVKSSMPVHSSATQATLTEYFERNPGGMLMLSQVTVANTKDAPGQLTALTGPTPKEALAAQTRLNEDHAEAARLMTKLAGSYTWSSMNIAHEERPTFPPMSSTVMPERPPLQVDDRQGAFPEHARTGPGESSGTVVGNSLYSNPSTEMGTRETVGLAGLSEQAPVPESQVSTGIAGGVSTPQAQPITPNGAGAPVNSTASVSGLGQPGGFFSSPIARSGSGSSGLGAAKNLPSVARPLTGPGTANGGASRLMPRGPAEHGISGGRPVSPSIGRPAGVIPRGTVVGSESAQSGYGRGGMGQGGAMGGGGASNGQAGMAGGRRLASEPGGVVGSRTQRSGAIAGQAFTPGGTGLVRGSAPAGNGMAGGRGGMAPPTGPQGDGSRDRETELDRPGCLTEDEETWAQDGRRVVPPVVD